MKQNIVYSYTTSQVTETPVFNNYSKFFTYIRFFINDQLIEELNEDVFNVNYYMYMNNEKRKQYDNITKIRGNTDHWELRIPLEFWFNNIAGRSIPLVALLYSQLRLEYKLNDITYILNNDLSTPYKLITPTFSNNIKLNIELNSSFIFLDTPERNLFGSYGHEYIIDRYRTYLANTINTSSTVIYKKFNGLVKDIFLIAKPTNYKGLTYFPQYVSNYDVKYARYTLSLEYYNIYTKNGNIYTPPMKDYTDDINIISSNIIEFNNWFVSSNRQSFTRITNLITTFSSWTYWDSSYNFMKYLMYYEDKYLTSVVNDIAMTNNILSMYIQYIYSNQVITNKISPIDTIQLKVNGTDLFAQRDSNYYTNVIPCQKFKNSLPVGYYCYSFSLEPNDMQWSGHLNFTNLDDIVIIVNSTSQNNGYYQLNTLLKEYNILRIMSGMASLAWVD
jgi:hypothetical protein